MLLTDACLKACPQYALARDRVRYCGEGVAVVIAEQRPIAEDALELVDVELEPLEPVASTEAALRAGAPQLHADSHGNRCAEWTLRTGDVDAAFLQNVRSIGGRSANPQFSRERGRTFRIGIDDSHEFGTEIPRRAGVPIAHQAGADDSYPQGPR